MLFWITLALCASASIAERISQTPDVSWNSRSSSNSDRNSGVFAENNVRPSQLRQSDAFARGSQTAGTGGFDSGSRFSGSNNDDDRFPVTGSRFSGSGSGSNSRLSGSDSRLSGSDSRLSGNIDNFDSSRSRNSGSGSRFSGSDSRLSGSDRFDSGSRGSSSSQDPNYVQIIASLVRLSNPSGKVSTGSSCASFGGKCDPLIYANLDTERPNANWPGAMDVKLWPLLLTAKKQNDVDIGISNITKQYCGQKYTEANLRVHVEDKKTLSSNAIINEFDCPINRDPARDQFSATWSPEAKCIPRFPKGGQELTYKYKIFYVDRAGCGATERSTSTTKGSWFGK